MTYRNIKLASRLEHQLIKAFLAKGKQVPISVLSKITGRSYDPRWKTVNQMVAAREKMFREQFVPAKKMYRQLRSRAVPLGDAVSGMKQPVYRGETKFTKSNPLSYKNHNMDALPDSITKKLPKGSKPTLLDRVEGRRFFADHPLNAGLYLTGRNGTGELIVADLGTPMGRWAQRRKVVVGTPQLDAPSTRWRRAVSRMIDRGELVPKRDISYPGATHYNPYSLTNEMTIPRWLRPFLKERRFVLTNPSDEMKWQRDPSKTLQLMKVLPGKLGEDYLRAGKDLNRLAREGGNLYNFKGMHALVNAIGD